eukprot:403358286
MNNFIILNKLGSGSFSDVFKVKRLSDQQIYALKKVKLSKLSEKEKENALNEVRILASIQDENVAAYKEAFFEEQTQSLCIIMEFADNGDLQTKIERHRKQGEFVSEEVVWRVLIDLLKGLVTLHNLKIVHRDIKCANIFLGKDDVAKLGDLNVSKIAKLGLMQTQTGTPYYASPEVWNDKPYDARCDIWSLGCVIYELAALNPPFQAKDMHQLYQRVNKGIYPSLPKLYSQELKNLIASLLTVDSLQRPNAEEVMRFSSILTERLPQSNYQENRQKSQEIKNRNRSLRVSQHIKEDGDCFSTDSSEKDQQCQYSGQKIQNKTESPLRKTKTLDCQLSNRKSGRKSVLQSRLASNDRQSLGSNQCHNDSLPSIISQPLSVSRNPNSDSINNHIKRIREKSAKLLIQRNRKLSVQSQMKILERENNSQRIEQSQIVLTSQKQGLPEIIKISEILKSEASQPGSSKNQLSSIASQQRLRLQSQIDSLHLLRQKQQALSRQNNVQSNLLSKQYVTNEQDKKMPPSIEIEHSDVQPPMSYRYQERNSIQNNLREKLMMRYQQQQVLAVAGGNQNNSIPTSCASLERKMNYNAPSANGNKMPIMKQEPAADVQQVSQNNCNSIGQPFKRKAHPVVNMKLLHMPIAERRRMKSIHLQDYNSVNSVNNEPESQQNNQWWV